MSAPSFAFVAEPLDRSDALRDRADVLSSLWPQAQIVLIDADGRCSTDASGQLHAPRGADLQSDSGSALFLGLRDEDAWFALSAEAVHYRAADRTDLRSAAALWPAWQATLFAQARALLHWQACNRYCGGCGGKLAFVRGGWEGRCAVCTRTHYPRTDPAIIVAVSDGARLLLGRQATWPQRRYSTLAGFVEPGESLEQAVIREVLEESGVRIRGTRYLASQPWPFPGSLMLGFVADAEPDIVHTGEELQDVRWFTRDQIGAALDKYGNHSELELSPSISISRWLIACWYSQAVAHG